MVITHWEVSRSASDKSSAITTSRQHTAPSHSNTTGRYLSWITSERKQTRVFKYLHRTRTHHLLQYSLRSQMLTDGKSKDARTFENFVKQVKLTRSNIIQLLHISHRMSHNSKPAPNDSTITDLRNNSNRKLLLATVLC